VTKVLTRRRNSKRAKQQADIARRVERILRTEPQYIHHASFDEPGAEREVLGALELETTARGNAVGSPAVGERRSDFYVAFLYSMDPLTRTQESVLFRGMNYIKFRAFRLRQRLDPQTATLEEVEAIEALEQRAIRIRNYIVESNLRLVTARAKQFARSTGLPLDELISEGNIGLVQAVEHFDYARGTKLSTYATWAITNKLLAYLHRSRRQASRVVGDPSDAMEIEDTDLPAVEEQLSNAELRALIGGLVSKLKDRERTAVETRFGLAPAAEAATLKDLASQWGVTKQRAQQVCAGAVHKLRTMLEESGFVLVTD